MVRGVSPRAAPTQPSPIWVRERTSRVSPIYGPLLNIFVTLVTAGLVFAVWVANRKRIAAETLGRAEEQALRITKDAERDAETRKKEALLEAKEKSHELLVDAERQASQVRQTTATLEQTLTRREATLTERQSAIERLERELNAPRSNISRSRENVGRSSCQVRAPGRSAATRARARGEPDSRRSERSAVEADRKRGEARRGEPGQASRCRSTRNSERPRQALHHRGYSALRSRACDRDDGVGRRSAERRPQGPHHRPRGSEHPRARAGHRCRPDHRRHARCDYPVRLRSVPARNRQTGHRATDRRRPYSSGANRRGRAEGKGRDRRGDCARKGPASLSSSGCTTFIPRSSG